jgi:predicted ribosome quality control (RQC) complex YloA/Tae2 family protein
MELHYTTLFRLTQELREKFKSGTIQNCYTQRKNELIIQISTDTGAYLDLLLSTDSKFPYILFRESQKRSKVSTNVMGELRDQVISNIIIHEKDRILEVICRNAVLKLLIQIFRNRTNFFLVDSEYNILDAFKQGKKLIGQQYNFMDLAQVSAEPESVTSFLTAVSNTAVQPLQKVIRKKYFLINQTIIKEIETRLSTKLDQPSGKYSDEELQKIFHSIKHILQSCRMDAPRIYSKDDSPVAFSLTALEQYKGLNEQQFNLINEALKYYLFSRAKLERQNKKTKKIDDLLQSKLTQIETLILHLQSLPEERQQQQYYQKVGELLLAEIANIPSGQKTASLIDLFDPDQKELKVSLDPNLSIGENAKTYFIKAKNVAEQVRQVKVNIRQLIEQKKKLLKLKKQLEENSDWKSLNRLEKQLAELHVLQTDTEKMKEVYLPYKRYYFKNWEIWVGKNAKANDDMTFKRAHKEDLWLHSQGVGGSHVIIHKKNRQMDIPKEVLEYAGRLAATNSRAKHSTYTPVIYTLVKYVRKPKGSAPGAVVTEREKSVFVEPL